jgi:hypothetical protein
MAEEQQDAKEPQRAADIAREQAVCLVVSLAVEFAIVLPLIWAAHHPDVIKLQAKRLRARLAPGRAPGDIDLQAAEFAAAVSAWDHSERSSR